LGVEFGEASPLFRHIVFKEDRFYRALWHASFAVDAFFRVNVKHLLAFIETFYGANNYAIGVTATKTRLSDDMSHVDSPSNKQNCAKVQSKNISEGNWIG